MTRADQSAVALLLITALAYTGVAVWVTVDPIGALAEVGVATSNSGGTVELRAMYGGLQLGLAGFLVFCASRREWRLAGMAAAVTTVGGLGLFRAVSLAVTQPDIPLLYVFAVLELSGAAAGIAWIAWTTRESRR